MSKELSRAEELVMKVQNDPELLKKAVEMTKEEALDLAKELGYGDVTEEEILEVINSDRELDDGSLGEVAGGRRSAFSGGLCV